MRNNKETTVLKGKIPNQEMDRLRKIGFIQQKNSSLFCCKVITRSGRLNVEELEALTRIASDYGDGELMLLGDGSVVICGIAYEQVDKVKELCAKYELITGGTGNKIRPIIACEEKVCPHGLVDTYQLAEKFRKLFFERLQNEEFPQKVTFGINGCPKNCGPLDIYDIGIEGVLAPQFDLDLCRGCLNCAVEKHCQHDAIKVANEKIDVNAAKCIKCGACVEKCPFGVTTFAQYAYRIIIGGGKNGKTDSGQHLSVMFTTEESLLSVVDRLLFLYLEEAKENETLGAVVSRIGIKTVEKKVLA